MSRPAYDRMRGYEQPTSESVPVLSTEPLNDSELEWYRDYANRPDVAALSMAVGFRRLLATLDAERAESLRRGDALNKALIERDDAREGIEALTEALRDATTLLPPDRWKLLREPTRRLVEADPRAALTSEAHRG